MAKTVLIVEDERAIVEILKFNLKREGYETLEALDGETGLLLAQANGLGQPEGVEAGMRRVTQVTSCVDFPAERESCPANGV